MYRMIEMTKSNKKDCQKCKRQLPEIVGKLLHFLEKCKKTQ